MSEEQVGTEEHVEPPQVDPQVAAEAMEQGWVPLDRWHHKPEEWIDAETFLKRGRELNPFLNKALKQEREKNKKLLDDINDLKQTVGSLAEYRAKLEKTIYNQAMKDIKANLR